MLNNRNVVASSESYRVSIKYIPAFEKSEKGPKWNGKNLCRALFYLSSLKYQHKLFVLTFLRFILRAQSKAENNVNYFYIFIFCSY